MNSPRLAATLLLPMLLVACASTPVGRSDSAVAAALANTALGAPRLPAAGEAYLDAAWWATPLTAPRAVQAALLNDPRVRAELARLDAAQAERVQAGLLANPMSSLMALRPQGGGRFELDYSLMQSLFDLFTRSRRIAAADAVERRVEAEVLGRLLALGQDAEAAYYDSIAAAQELRIRRDQLLLEVQQRDLVQRQARQGVLPTAASLQQQASASSRARELHMAEARLVQARAMLARALGLPSSAALRLPEEFPAFVMPGLDAPALQALAASHRPELQAAAANELQARAERAIQTGALRATMPSLGPAGMRDSSGMSLNGLGLQISLPVFDQGQARRALTDAQVAQAGFASESLRRQVPLEVEQAIATLLASHDATEQAMQHLHRQQQLEQLARGSYQQGASDRPAYLQASQARMLSELDLVQARQSLWSALVALERAAGSAKMAL